MEIVEKASRQSSRLEKLEETLNQGVQWNQGNQLSEKSINRVWKQCRSRKYSMPRNGHRQGHRKFVEFRSHKNDEIYILIYSKKNLSSSVNYLTTENQKLVDILSYVACKTGKIKQKITTNTMRTWDKREYCWTHGYKLKLVRSSLTCFNPAEGHHNITTRWKVMEEKTSMGGCLKLNDRL